MTTRSYSHRPVARAIHVFMLRLRGAATTSNSAEVLAALAAYEQAAG